MPLYTPQRAGAFLAVFGAALLFDWLDVMEHAHFRPRHRRHLPCSSFTQRGWMEAAYSTPLQTNWTTLGPCPAPPRWINKLYDLVHSDPLSSEEQRLRDELSFLSNQTILFIGDSIDRMAVDGMAQLLYHHNAAMTSHASPEVEGQDPLWTTHQSPRYLHIPQLDFRMVNAFHFGMSLDFFENGVWPYERESMCDCVGPLNFEDTIDLSILPMAKRLTVSPTVVVLSSMNWDLKYFHLAKLAPEDTREPLPLDLVQGYRDRLVAATNHVLDRFPTSAFLFRGGYQAFTASENFRSSTRDLQLLDAQEAAIVDDLGLPFMPTSRILGGFWQLFGEADLHLRPPPSPGTVALQWPVLDYLYRRSRGATTF